MIKLLHVSALGRHKLHLEYEDGTTGDVDVSNLIGKGVFNALSDEAMFNAVCVGDQGEVRWNDDLELCADALYLQLTGKRAEDLFPNLKATADT